MAKAAIMLGGNLPGSEKAFSLAENMLEQSGFKITAVSRIFHSAAVDCVPGTPDFIDRAVTGIWNDSPEALLELCQKIERTAGRPAEHSSRESRILDCDIILFDTVRIDLPQLKIPHPRAASREFVLRPLSEIAGQWEFPGGGTVEEKLHALTAGC